MSLAPATFFLAYLSKISFAFPSGMEEIAEVATLWLASAFCLAQEIKSEACPSAVVVGAAGACAVVAAFFSVS